MKLGTVEEIEQEIIKEQVGNVKIKEMDKDKEDAFIGQFIQLLNKEKEDGEKVFDFEKRVLSEALQVLEIETA